MTDSSLLPSNLLSDWYWRKGSLYVVKNLIVGFTLAQKDKSWIFHPDSVLLLLGYTTRMSYYSKAEPLLENIEFYFLDEGKIVLAVFPSMEQAGYSLAYRNPHTGKLIAWQYQSDLDLSDHF